MSVIHYKGIVWETSGTKDGKGVLVHGNCSVSYDKEMEVFQFKQDGSLVLARELRGDCLKDATDCILDSYADQFVPSWEQDNGSAQEAQS